MTPEAARAAAALAAGVAVLVVAGAPAPRAWQARWVRRARERGVNAEGWPIATVLATGTSGLAATAAVALGGASGAMAATALCGTGLLVPVVFEAMWARRHEDALARALPMFARQWATALDGGCTVADGFREAARRATGPLSLESRRAWLAWRVGAGTLAQCLRARAVVLASPSLADLASTLGAVERTGAPLAELLEILAVDLDRRESFRGQVRAAARGPLQELGAIYCFIAGFAALLPRFLGVLAGPGHAADSLHAGDVALLLTACAVPLVVVARLVRRDAFLG